MSNLRVWRNRELSKLKSDVDALFDGLCHELGLPPLGEEFGAPSLDVEDAGAEVVVRMVLPGIDPNRLEITVSGESLRIGGEQDLEQCGAMRRVRFQSSVRLPARVREEAATASYHADVLEIRLPKLGPRERKVRIACK
jgi:HSP20 family protein